MMLNHMIRIPFVGLIIIQRSGLTKRGRFVVPLCRKHESAANARPVASNQSTRLPPSGSVTFPERQASPRRLAQPGARPIVPMVHLRNICDAGSERTIMQAYFGLRTQIAGVLHGRLQVDCFSFGTWMSKPLLNDPFALLSNKASVGGRRLMPAP
jgi:hypothetical protein